MKYIVGIVFIFLFKLTYCQTDSSSRNFQHQAIFVGGLGHSRGLFSVNYEFLFRLRNPFFLLTFSTGIGYTPGINVNNEKLRGTVYIPGVVSAVIGKKNHFLQLGAGYTAGFGQGYIDSISRPSVIYQQYESAYIVSAGYRYMNRHGTIVQLYPLFQWTNNPSDRFAVSFGFFIGQRF
jgi:hypothetical protein